MPFEVATPMPIDTACKSSCYNLLNVYIMTKVANLFSRTR